MCYNKDFVYSVLSLCLHSAVYSFSLYPCSIVTVSCYVTVVLCIVSHYVSAVLCTVSHNVQAVLCTVSHYVLAVLCTVSHHVPAVPCTVSRYISAVLCTVSHYVPAVLCTVFFFKSGTDKSTEWSMIPVCPSLMCFFNRGDTKGIILQKFVFDVCVSFVLYRFVSGLILWFMDNLWFDDLHAE